MKPLSLTIQKPCAEKWNSFTPTASGGFCARCNKVVTDFTTLRDEEIIAALANQSQPVCGRFRPDQLKIYGTSPLASVRPGFTLLRAGLIGLFVLLLSKPVSARITHEQPQTEIAFVENVAAKVMDIIHGELTVKGVVRSREDKSTLPGVNVILKGSTHGTVTDANGYFEFPVALKEGDVLIFAFIGLETQEYKVPNESKQSIEIEMELYMNMDIMGEVAVHGVYPNQSSGIKGLWHKVKAWF